MKEIPFLLAGPIIRRVEPTKVAIWFATSNKIKVKAALFEISQSEEDSYTYQSINIKSTQDTIRIGSHLFIHLLIIQPEEIEFPTDTLLGYNLHFSNKENSFDLGDLQLLDKENPNSIVYGNLNYPSFFIQKQQNTNILYGSCQKPHGKGNNAFIRADDKIEENYQTLKNRPSALFLMGDQIYADDVADPIFPVLTKWRNILMGEKNEALLKIEPYLKQEPFVSSIDKVHSRQFATENFAKLTSGNADNHLFRFGEFAVMYLLTLGPSLWEGKDKESVLPSFGELIEDNLFYLKYVSNKKENYNMELEQHQQRYEVEMNETIPYIQSLGMTRRILANTPTYMIFDDHDITDDWNISYDWVDNVYQTPLGKHIIANGLTAYLIFQSWGNEPTKYKSLIRELSTQLDYYSHSSLFDENWIQQILQYHDWSFVAPTYPRSLFLDTRTMRSYDLQPKPIRVFNKIEEGKRAALLIGDQGWKIINTTLKQSDWKERDPLIIISPTPFYGIGIIESFLKRIIYPLRSFGVPVQYNFDFEAWKYNGEGFTNFLKQITKWKPSPCIILSGDVHYAGAVKSHITYEQKEKITIHQFTSSPIHNVSFPNLLGKMMKLVVKINSLQIHRRTIYRYCDNKYYLYVGKPQNKNNLKWEEEITYLPVTNGKTIETNNNIGLLTLHSLDIFGRLLQ